MKIFDKENFKDSTRTPSWGIFQCENNSFFSYGQELEHSIWKEQFWSARLSHRDLPAA